MQEMQDKTLAEIAKAFKGSFIYAPGGTVNIGCNIFEAGQAPKKKADPKKSETNNNDGSPKATRRRRSPTTKVDEKVEPPKGNSAPPPEAPPAVSDDDVQGDGDTDQKDANQTSAPNSTDVPTAPFNPSKGKKGSSRRRGRNSNSPPGAA